MNRKRVAVMFGGRSAEHEVSLASARNVVAAMDRDKYDPVLIGIDRQGRWLLEGDALPLLDADDPRLIRLGEGGREVALTANGQNRRLIALEGNTPAGGPATAANIDVVFPLLHGPYGEDGSVQGLLRLADLPCVGAGVVGSAVGMDKDVMKRLLRDAGIPTADYRRLTPTTAGDYPWEVVSGALGSPLYVKPANLGSSVGVSRAGNAAEYQTAVTEAFSYDRKVIVEEEVVGREIECAVLGNETPEASGCGEIQARDGFYDYRSKYVDDDGAELLVPAPLPVETAEEVRELAVKTFQVLECRGMARVDFFLREDGQILVNEINTIPGFTEISMYPRLWEASGISYPRLVDRLIELAVEDHESQRSLRIDPGIV